MIKRLLLIALILVLAAPLVVKSIFTVPEHATLKVQSHQFWQESADCFSICVMKPLDREGEFSLLVWNIYKQNREGWQQALTQMSQDKQLVLLQEVSLTPEFDLWLQGTDWVAQQANAFEALETSTGVMTLAKNLPHTACAFSAKEPWLRLPKSALYTQYPLSNGQELAVVNLHAINFTIGTKEYYQQLEVIDGLIRAFPGPIIFAGDFNTWSVERMSLVNQLLIERGFRSTAFYPDHRTQFVTGLPLDHVYYKGLTLKTAEAPMTDASDHNPLLVTFQL